MTYMLGQVITDSENFFCSWKIGPGCLYGMLFIGWLGVHHKGRQQVAVVTEPLKKI
jgi:hypothetical protein